MKTVFSSASDVIHLFAQRTQSNARSSNCFFEHGTRLYSYGYHYLLAEFVENSAGETAIIINDRGYSNTTAKHISQTIGATRQYKQFYTSETDINRVIYYLENYLQKLQNARKPELYILPGLALIDRHKEWLNWNNFPENIEVNKFKELFSGGDYSEYLANKRKEIELQEQKRIKEKKKQHAKNLRDFYNHKVNYIYNSFGTDYVRLSKDKTYVETSQSVRIPVKSARTLYLMIQAKKDIKGYNIEGYTVISSNGTLKIGCHNINMHSVHKVGKQIINL